MNDATLKELWQQVAEQDSAEAKYKELCAQRETVAAQVKKLEKARRNEQADVDRLEGGSLAAFFYQVIGKMDEKLDKEREEAYAARVKADAAARELASIDAALKAADKAVAKLEAQKTAAEAKAAQQARQAEIDSALQKLISDGMSVDEILNKLK